MTLRFEMRSLAEGDCGSLLIDATYLCGLSRWLLVGAGTDSIKMVRHAVWNPRAQGGGEGGGRASIEASEASAKHAQASSRASHSMDWRGIGPMTSAFFSHGVGGSRPLAPPDMPAKDLFTGFDPNC